MRIRNIRISQWRHFENVELSLGDDTPLVCVVGANGTGKSHLLELIAACAHRLGLSPGVELPRGDPFSDVHDFSLCFYVAEGVSDAIDAGLESVPQFAEWDRTLTIESRRGVEGPSKIYAGGIEDEGARQTVAAEIVRRLAQTKDVHFLSLDANRAYPKRDLNVNQAAQAYEIDWAGPDYTRGRSFRSTETLYDDFLKHFLAQENQSGTQLIQDMRRAKKDGAPPPEFDDHFASFTESLQKVLPHVFFAGVDSKKRALLFDTTGLELTFNQLSGGEREIAFLVGQIDRFGLRQGLFLLDEPELHLNADLIRAWVAYLTSTVQQGQIWLATHSLEAVEAAGQHATFVIERDEETRKVNSLARLDTRPVLSALSRSVGTPAFSISKLRFVFVEGEEGVGERERFRKLAGSPENVRFIECGSCNEVLRRVRAIIAMAEQADVGIRAGGVVDRDFQTKTKADELKSDEGVHMLHVHEVENFFLHPKTLTVLLDQNGQRTSPQEIILRAADARAGSWIFQYAMSTPNAHSLPEIPVTAKDHAKSLSWADFASETAAQAIASHCKFEARDAKKVQSILDVSIRAYRRARESDDLWKKCEGKQVLNEVARASGFSGTPALIRAVFAAWERDTTAIPAELQKFRSYLSSL